MNPPGERARDAVSGGGSPPFGMVPILKPPGMTSHDVVAVLRRVLGERRVGHAGTLDPLAVGVLPVAVGGATRLLRYLPGTKAYRAEVEFGRATDTLDAAGHLVADAPFPVDEAALRAVLPTFTGEVQQLPPMASAVKHQGQRLYALQRQGVEVADRAERRVTVHALSLVSFTPGAYPRAILDVTCSAGTYVRTLAADLGAALGGPAHLTFLLRTAACGFEVAEAVRLAEGSRDALVGPDRFLSEMPAVRLDPAGEADARHGRLVRLDVLPAAGHARLEATDGTFLGVGRVTPSGVQPETMMGGGA